MTHFILDLLAFGAILSSILVITSKNPVIAVIYLISVFINAAGYLLILGVGFIGITYILLYVGAITILFLFVIMSINIKLTDIMEAGSQYTKSIPLALSIGFLFIYELVSILPSSLLNIGRIQGESEISILSYPVELLKTLNNGSAALLDQSNLNLEYSQFFKNILELDSSTGISIYETANPMTDAKITAILQLESLGQGLYTYGVSWLIVCSVILLLALVAPTFITRNSK